MQVHPERAAADRHDRLVSTAASTTTGHGSRRPERRDRVALVAGHRTSLVGVGQRHAPHAQMGAQLGPVEPPTRGHQHEQVVVVTPAHDDRAEQPFERDALKRGRLLRAAGPLGHDDPVRDAGRGDGRGSRACRDPSAGEHRSAVRREHLADVGVAARPARNATVAAISSGSRNRPILTA